MSSSVPTLRRVTAQLLRIRRKQLGLTQTEAAVQVAAIAEALGYPPRRVEQTTWRYWEKPEASKAGGGIDSSWWLPLSVWMRLGDPLNFAILLMSWPITSGLSLGIEASLERLEDESDALMENMEDIGKGLPGRSSLADVRAHFEAISARSSYHRNELRAVADEVHAEIQTLIDELVDQQNERGISALDLRQVAAGQVTVTLDESLVRMTNEQRLLQSTLASIERTLMEQVVPMTEQVLSSQVDRLGSGVENKTPAKPDE